MRKVTRGKMGHFNWGYLGHVQASPKGRSLAQPTAIPLLMCLKIDYQ
jgi:hypothetical protein